MQDNGLVPIVEPEILLDGEHNIDRTFEVAQKVWAEVFFYLAENNVQFEGILLKPSMVTPGAECKDRATPEQVAAYTLKLLKTRIPPAVPGIMVYFLFQIAYSKSGSVVGFSIHDSKYTRHQTFCVEHELIPNYLFSPSSCLVDNLRLRQP